MELLASYRIGGHDVFLYIETETYFYRATGEIFPLNERPCALCGKNVSKKGHDACIADLPGVRNACCGHGRIVDAYIAFENGKIIYRERALEYMRTQHADAFLKKETNN